MTKLVSTAAQFEGDFADIARYSIHAPYEEVTPIRLVRFWVPDLEPAEISVMQVTFGQVMLGQGSAVLQAPTSLRALNDHLAQVNWWPIGIGTRQVLDLKGPSCRLMAEFECKEDPPPWHSHLEQAVLWWRKAHPGETLLEMQQALRDCWLNTPRRP